MRATRTPREKNCRPGPSPPAKNKPVVLSHPNWASGDSGGRELSHCPRELSIPEEIGAASFMESLVGDRERAKPAGCFWGDHTLAQTARPTLFWECQVLPNRKGHKNGFQRNHWLFTDVSVHGAAHTGCWEWGSVWETSTPTGTCKISTKLLTWKAQRTDNKWRLGVLLGREGDPAETPRPHSQPTDQSPHMPLSSGYT